MKGGIITFILKGETYIALTLPEVIIENYDKFCQVCALIHPKKKYKNCLKIWNSCWTVICKTKPNSILSTKCNDCKLFFEGLNFLISHKRSGSCKCIKHCNDCNRKVF